MVNGDNPDRATYNLDGDEFSSEKLGNSEPIELEIVTRTREDAERYLKKAAQLINQDFFTRLAKSLSPLNEVAATIAETTQKALSVSMSPLVQRIASDWVDQLQAPSKLLLTSIKNSHENLAQSIQGASSTLLPSIVEPLKSIRETLSASFKSITPINLSVISELFSPTHLLGVVGVMMKRFTSSLSNLLSKIVPPDLTKLFDYIYSFFRKRYELLVKTAAGDKDAALELSRHWHVYRTTLFTVRNMQGYKVSIENRDSFLIGEIISATDNFMRGQKDSKRNWLAVLFLAQFCCALALTKDLHTYKKQELKETLLRDAQHKEHNHFKNVPTLNIDGEPYIFVWVAALLAGKSEETIRSWIKKRIIPGEKTPYFSVTRRKWIEPYLIPWNADVLNRLLRSQQQINTKDLISGAELRKKLGISEMNLWRLAQQQLITPIKIGNRNYFSPKDVRIIVESRLLSRSNRLRSQLPEFQAKLAALSQ